jgi:hypothetical protein
VLPLVSSSSLFLPVLNFAFVRGFLSVFNRYLTKEITLPDDSDGESSDSSSSSSSSSEDHDEQVKRAAIIRRKKRIGSMNAYNPSARKEKLDEKMKTLRLKQTAEMILS